MDLSISTCFVFVHDPDLALAFYRDVLGLELRNDVAQGETRWLTLGSVEQPDVAVVLSNHVGGSAEDAAAMHALAAKGLFNALHLRSDDLDATFEKVRASGADVVSEPADQFWGVRDCAVRDPSGNLVRIDQRPS